MSETFDLLIIGMDDVYKEVHKVEDYGIMDGHTIFYYKKNGRLGFVPVGQVRFFGCKADYTE